MALSRVLLLGAVVALAFCSPVTVAQQQRQGNPDVAPSNGQRKMLDFWGVVLALIGPHHGPPHPHHHSSSSSGGSDGDDSEASAAAIESSQYSWNDGSDASASASQYAGKETVSGAGGVTKAKLGFSPWIIGAIASAMAAMFAINMGQKKNPLSSSQNGIRGAVARRNEVVTAFADGALESNSQGVELSQRGVEVV